MRNTGGLIAGKSTDRRNDGQTNGQKPDKRTMWTDRKREKQLGPTIQTQTDEKPSDRKRQTATVGPNIADTSWARLGNPGVGHLLGRQVLADVLALVKVGDRSEGWLQPLFSLESKREWDGDMLGWRQAWNWHCRESPRRTLVLGNVVGLALARLRKLEKDLGGRLGAETADRVCEGSRCWFGVGRGESWRRIEVLVDVPTMVKVTAGRLLGLP